MELLPCWSALRACWAHSASRWASRCCTSPSSICRAAACSCATCNSLQGSELQYKLEAGGEIVHSLGQTSDRDKHQKNGSSVKQTSGSSNIRRDTDAACRHCSGWPAAGLPAAAPRAGPAGRAPRMPAVCPALLRPGPGQPTAPCLSALHPSPCLTSLVQPSRLPGDQRGRWHQPAAPHRYRSASP